MDRLGFFKHGLSSLIEVAQSIVGLKHAADSFTEAVDEALSNIQTDIGLFLPSLDAAMYEDPQGTIYDVAEMGYAFIEVGAYGAGKVHNLPATRVKELADGSGLKIRGAHINKLYEHPVTEQQTPQDAEPQNNEQETSQEPKPDPNVVWWQKALDNVQAMGCRYVTMSRLPDYPTKEVVSEYITYFNLIGELAAERDIQFCFHPRKEEFLRKENKSSAEENQSANQHVSIFDRIAAECDAAKVKFEIDTREATEAGNEVTELLKTLGNRVELLHIHDYGTACESGKIDFEKIIAEGIRSGVKDIIIEVSSYSLPPKNCVERSLQNVRNLPSVRF
ncbi:MAG: TIM barrel protein [Alistipes sp.]|nr:TIM barrel protein [Alistipes sp.]